MKVLVTGGAGYLGSLLVHELLKQKIQVVIYDNFSWGIQPILHYISDPNLEVVAGDVRDKEALKNVMRGCEYIYHLASIVGYPACKIDPIRAKTTNVGGTENLVENLEPRQNILFASTGSSYGEVNGLCTEDTPINPLTLYGETKAKAENLCLEKGGVALRFSTVFGVSTRLRLDVLVNDFVYQAIHSKQIVLYESHFRRTFLHISDAVNSFLFAMEHFNKMSGKAFNVGHKDLNYTKKDIAFLIQKYTQCHIYEGNFAKDLEKRNYEVSFDRISKQGFKAQVTLEEGIKELKKAITHIKLLNPWRNDL